MSRVIVVGSSAHSLAMRLALLTPPVVAVPEQVGPRGRLDGIAPLRFAIPQREVAQWKRETQRRGRR